MEADWGTLRRPFGDAVPVLRNRHKIEREAEMEKGPALGRALQGHDRELATI
jgi:hypothetical protein